MSLCLLICRMNIKRTPKQAYSEKETGSVGKACGTLADARIQRPPLHTHGHTHFFPYKVLRASQLLGVPSQSGQIWEVWKVWEDQSPFLPLSDSERGQRSPRNTQPQTLRRGLGLRVYRPWLVLLSTSKLHQPHCNILSKTGKSTVQMAQVHHLEEGVTRRSKCLLFHKITARNPATAPSVSFSPSLVDTADVPLSEAAPLATLDFFKTQVSFPEKESKVSHVYPLPPSK